MEKQTRYPKGKEQGQRLEGHLQALGLLPDTLLLTHSQCPREMITLLSGSRDLGLAFVP